MSERDPRLTRGMELFNAEEFFDAHEIIEEFWQEDGSELRDLWKGFIQAAVAYEHHRRGNPKGMRSVGTTATGYLAEFDDTAGGLDVRGLQRDLEGFLAAVDRGETPPYPKARWLGSTTHEEER